MSSYLRPSRNLLASNSAKLIGLPWSLGPRRVRTAVIPMAAPLSIRESSQLARQHPQLAWQREAHMLLAHGPALDRGAVAVLQVGHALLDHVLRRAGPGGDENRFC